MLADTPEVPPGDVFLIERLAVRLTEHQRPVFSEIVILRPELLAQFVLFGFELTQLLDKDRQDLNGASSLVGLRRAEQQAGRFALALAPAQAVEPLPDRYRTRGEASFAGCLVSATSCGGGGSSPSAPPPSAVDRFDRYSRQKGF